MRRGVLARPRGSRGLRLVLTSAVGICLLFALTASARVGAGPFAGGVLAKPAAAPFPLSVRKIALRKLRGRIVGTATIVNTGNAPVRSTTGLLGLSRGSGDSVTGILTFSLPSLRARSSRRVQFRTWLVRRLPVRSGRYKVVICTDVYSQIQRFAQSTNCSPGATLPISTISYQRPSGPVPNTIIRRGVASIARSSTAVFGFVSTVRRSTFECGLDGGPWLVCSSPQRYTGLADGRHAFDVRAISASGKKDPTPARASWTVDRVAPAVTLRTPVSGSTTNNNKPVFSGAAGMAPWDSSTITVKVLSGSSTSGSRVLTLTANVSRGSWSVVPTQPLTNGTYTAQAEQSDSVGNTGVSTPSTFTIDTPPPTPTPTPTPAITQGTAVLTFHNDNMRTGGDLNETVLTPSNVNSSSFGKLFSYPLDGLTLASPLYVPNVKIPGQGFHNVVIVATEHDSVYAFDADGGSSSPLWHVNFTDPAAGVTSVPAADTGETGDIPNEIGITGTPVIDPATGTIYVVAATKEVSGGTTNYVQRLHALDLTTGAEKFGGPVVINASVPGTGDGSSGGTLTFNSLRENQRTGLLLSNGVVYFGFSSPRRPGPVPRLGARLQRVDPATGHGVQRDAKRLARRGVDGRRRDRRGPDRKPVLHQRRRYDGCEYRRR